MAEPQNIDDTKEAITLIVKLLKAVMDAGEDGYQWHDSLEILDPELREALQDAIDNVNDIPVEFSDLSLRELLDLIDHGENELRVLIDEPAG